MTLTDDLARIAQPYCNGLDITQSWSPIPPPGVSPEPDRIEISAAVSADVPGAAPVAEVRAALLAQAEKIIEAYAEAGWVLDHEPGFDFSSLVQPAVVTIRHEMIRPPREHGAGLLLRLILRGRFGAPQARAAV